MNFCFGDIVVVDGNLIGVVVKSWIGNTTSTTHDVYVREYNTIKNYPEAEMQRYMVRHKFLDEDEMYYQSNAINGW